MTVRKQFNYVTSTVQQIADHFSVSTRQTIHAIRKHYKDDVSMTTKLDEAYRIVQKAKLQAKIDSLSIR